MEEVVCSAVGGHMVLQPDDVTDADKSHDSFKCILPMIYKLSTDKFRTMFSADSASSVSIHAESTAAV